MLRLMEALIPQDYGILDLSQNLPFLKVFPSITIYPHRLSKLRMTSHANHVQMICKHSGWPKPSTAVARSIKLTQWCFNL